MVRACVRGKAEFSLVMTKNRAIARAIDSLPETAWTPVRYPNAVHDPDTGGWISDAEVAEVAYTAFAHTKDRTTARLVVRRVKDARYPMPCFRSGGTTHSSPTAPSPLQSLMSPTAGTRSSKPPSPT